MNSSLRIISIVSVLFLSACNADLPIRTARPELSGNENSGTSDGASDENSKTTESTPTPTAAPAPTPAETAKKPDESTPTVVQKVDLKLSDSELQKYAYELGLDPKKPLKDEEKKMIADRKQLRQLERGLDSQKERLQYSKVLPWFKNDQEKIEMLSIPSIEGRQAWINKNKIWSRTKSLKEFDDVVEAQDIALGMPAEYVKRSWGEPTSVEISGNPIYRNERWQYNKQISTPQGYKQERRHVYFEGGRVVGWETE